MEIHELTHVSCFLLYVAHSYARDETCQIQIWHRHLFTKYCSVRTLNSAVFRLLEPRSQCICHCPSIALAVPRVSRHSSRARHRA